MSTRLKLAVDIELVQHAEQTVLLISFRREALPEWCLGLCLLQTGLIQSLIVTEKSPESAMEVRIRMNAQSDRTPRATLTPTNSEVELTQSSLGYLQHFFLKYYRDGVAAVDHLDLEAIDATTERKDVYITLRVPNSVSPATAEEAENRLGQRGNRAN